MPNRRLVILSVLAAAGLLAGCGSDSSDPRGSTAPPAASESAPGSSASGASAAASGGSGSSPAASGEALCDTLPALADVTKYSGVADLGEPVYNSLGPSCDYVSRSNSTFKVVFGATPGDLRAGLKSTGGLKDSTLLPGAVQGSATLYVFKDGTTFSVQVVNDKDATDTSVYDQVLELLKVWGKA